MHLLWRKESDSGDAATFSWIPIVGPWLMLSQDLFGYEAPVVISGIVQGAAAILIILGVSLRRTWTETEYVVDQQPVRVSFDASPMEGGGFASVTVTM